MMKIKKADRNALLSRLFGNNIARAREIVAAGLIFMRITPNMLTVIGCLHMIAAGCFLALGAGDRPGSSTLDGHSWFAVWATVMIFLASCYDILDGAVAKNSNRITKLGGFLDSTFDRFADGAIFLGIMIYYLNHPDLSHAGIFAIAAVVALINSLTVSYIKARAETVIDSCPVGYWQRGERLSAVMIGCVCGHTATAIVLLAIFPFFTVLRRLEFSVRQIDRLDKGIKLIDPRAKITGLNRLQLWRYRRMTVQYDFITGFIIFMIWAVDLQNTW